MEGVGCEAKPWMDGGEQMGEKKDGTRGGHTRAIPPSSGREQQLQITTHCQAGMCGKVRGRSTDHSRRMGISSLSHPLCA